jgi:predicted ATPase/DNA-binding NarL/FixJ family response regulator
VSRTTPSIQDDTLTYQQAGRSRSLTVGSPDWYAWLADAATFAFTDRHGSFTARKEPASNGRGGWYWRAYRKRDGSLRHFYLGPSGDLTPERLRAAAVALNERTGASGASSEGRSRPDHARRPAGRWTFPLPEPLSSFVGRARELAEVAALLPTTRLLTLTGAGGCGKTRLALQVAAEWRDHQPGGVCLVDLAPLADPDLVPQAVAAALGIAETPTRPLLDTLAAALRRRRLLLALDNCEHLLDACAEMAAALSRVCPGLRLLATSREPLGLPGEVAWPVPPLAEPEAARLFAERAAAARPGFALTVVNAPAVAEICRRLDGLPLAIELAAARARALTVEQIAARLDDRFTLLNSGGRTALSRHRTLRAALDWSHDQLTAAEQAVLRRLAVFAGGWQLEAAEAICSGDGLAAADVLDLLMRLVDKSLALAETDLEMGGEARYRLLETVRQYAAEKLAEAGEETAMRDHHAAWCLALAEVAAPRLVGVSLLPWLERLDAERDNLRAALAWLLERDPAAGLRLAGGLRHFWLLRSHVSEGRRWYDRLLPRAPAPTAARVRALLGAAFIARLQRTYPAALAWGEEALALSRALGEARLIAEALHMVAAIHIIFGDGGLARSLLEEGVALCQAGEDRGNLSECLYYLGHLAQWKGEYNQARAYYEESLALGPSVGDFAHTGANHIYLGNVALFQGDDARAEVLLEEALARARRVGSPFGVSSALRSLGRVAAWRGDLGRAAGLLEESLALDRRSLLNDTEALLELGRVAAYRGDLARAVALLEEGLAQCRAAGHQRDVGAALLRLGLAVWRQGDAARALAYLRESLGLRRALGNRLSIAECLEAVAMVAAGTNEPERAARLLGAAAGLRDAGGTPLPPVERPDHEASAAAARSALGEAAFAAAWAAGAALTLEQAVAEALGAREMPPAPVAPTPRDPAGLTRREVEVLRLLAAGRSNRAIAREFSLSVRTVERHIANLYGKIDAANRAEATAYAVRRGLA